MIDLLKIAGILMALYGLYGIYTNQVYAKSGRFVHKEEEPVSFWIVCLGYVFVGRLIFFAIEHKYG